MSGHCIVNLAATRWVSNPPETKYMSSNRKIVMRSLVLWFFRMFCEVTYGYFYEVPCTCLTLDFMWTLEFFLQESLLLWVHELCKKKRNKIKQEEEQNQFSSVKIFFFNFQILYYYLFFHRTRFYGS
jgi:hypothetical protein